MSRGLGRTERAILDILEDEDTYDDFHGADDLADTVYRLNFKAHPNRAQIVAVLRAMHSLVRKYPDRLALAGGKGREPLWIGTHRAIARLLAD